MSFVYPGFLWALLLLAIPIIIHLFHFRRYKKILFPNVRFLQNVQKQTQSVKKVRNLLVLLARLLAISFLVFAFAQPYKPINNVLQTNDEIIGLYLDNSFSMENEGSQGPLIEEAKEKARKLIKAYPNSDRFLIHTNESNPQQPLSQDDAIAFIDNVDIEKNSRPLEDALKALETGLANNGVGSKEIYVFSDLQKSESLKLGGQLDTVTALSIVNITPNENGNVSIDTAWFENPVIHLNEPVELHVSLTNYGSTPVTGVPLSLEINGVKKAVASVSLEAGQSFSTQIGFSVSQPGWKKALLHIEDAPILFDDTYHLSFNVKPNVRILVANGSDYTSDVKDPLTSVFVRDASFEVIKQEAGNIDLSQLVLADLVVLNELNSISSGLISALYEYISKGGSLLLIPSRSSSSNYLDDLTKRLGILPYGKRVELPIGVGKINLTHPLFDEVWTGERSNAQRNLDYPKVNQYVQMSVGNKAVNEVLVLENSDIFLSSSRLGSGEIYQLATPLADEWSNFRSHWLFATLLPKMALNRSLDYPLSYTISSHNLFKAVPEARGLQGELQLKGDDAEWIPVVNTSGSSPFIDAGYDDLAAGTVELGTGDSILQVIAFNYDRSESSNTYYSIDDIKLNAPEISITEVVNPETYVKETVTTKRFGKRYWKWCIILALIFLAFEIFLLRFWPTEVSQ
ncbi:MAG: BatA and WFA domain-containing protein [Bacteroidia bacterium]|nr:BatA and WFA domain-containing protein [Bacteroidia bacterium]